jgi:hypothetical protein
MSASMTKPGRPLHRTLRALLCTGALAMGVVGGAAPGALREARADEEPPVKAGTVLLARADCELQKVLIARGSRVEVTAAAGSEVSIALPDGYVLKHVGLNRVRYFFDVVR